MAKWSMEGIGTPSDLCAIELWPRKWRNCQIQQTPGTALRE